MGVAVEVLKLVKVQVLSVQRGRGEGEEAGEEGDVSNSPLVPFRASIIANSRVNMVNAFNFVVLQKRC